VQTERDRDRQSESERRRIQKEEKREGENRRIHTAWRQDARRLFIENRSSFIDPVVREDEIGVSRKEVGGRVRRRVVGGR